MHRSIARSKEIILRVVIKLSKKIRWSERCNIDMFAYRMQFTYRLLALYRILAAVLAHSCSFTAYFVWALSFFFILIVEKIKL